MLEKIKFKNFTAFSDLEVEFSKGINIFVGENGTGKTNLMKAAYAACSFASDQKTFAQKILGVFRPFEDRIGRLVQRVQGRKTGSLAVTRALEGGDSITIRLALSTANKNPEKATLSSSYSRWQKEKDSLNATYIPAEEFLSHSRGFVSLATYRNIHFEDIYADLLLKASTPPLRGPTEKKRKKILKELRSILPGKAVLKGEQFFLQSKQGSLEFMLVSEGYKKIALLWLLVQNGVLGENSVLFWDEPEANLNPVMMEPVVKALLELQRMGVQVFIATHEYLILAEFDLQCEEQDKVRFHSLWRDKLGYNNIRASHTAHLEDVEPNSIDETFGKLIDREISRSMGSAGK